MDIEAAKFLFQIAQFVMLCVVSFYVYMSNKDKVTNDRVTGLQDDLQAKHEDHSQRIAKLEEGPTHDDLGKLRASLSEVGNGVSNLAGELVGIKTTLNLVHQYLLNNKK